jgi:hypothetical protein
MPSHFCLLYAKVNNYLTKILVCGSSAHHSK